MNVPSIGFIHIGKTGGTALKSVFRRHVERTGAGIQFLQGHTMSFPRMRAEYPELRALFFVRDPVARIVSDFTDRLRQSRPRHDLPWLPAEAIALKAFATPNELAEGLGSRDPSRRRLAEFAMNAIVHVANRLSDYLGPVSFLQKELNSIFYIGDITTFDHDFAVLKRLLSIDQDIALPNDDVEAHRSSGAASLTIGYWQFGRMVSGGL
jgi:Sulfotransferase family